MPLGKLYMEFQLEEIERGKKQNIKTSLIQQMEMDAAIIDDATIVYQIVYNP